MTELLTATSHSGAHIDALAHMTVGEDAHWYGGANAAEHLGDFGPTVGDAAALPPIFTRGVLLDVAGHRGVECLPAGSVVDADEVAAIAAGLDVPEIREHDVVLFRTGYMGLWPDAARMAEHRSPGPGPVRGATGSWNGEWWRSAATPRRSRCSPRPTPACPPTRSRCTPGC